jgi:hypothetical protein
MTVISTVLIKFDSNFVEKTCNASYEVFTAKKIHIVFWVVMPCSDVAGYQCSLHPADGGNKVLQTGGIIPHHYIGVKTQKTTT